MSTLTISRAHHQLRLTHPGQRTPTLAVADALPDALAAALDRHGTIGSAVVCIRRVSTRVRVPAAALRLPAAALAQWADGLAAAIERDVSNSAARGGVADIVWFRDRGAVVGDVIAGAARGDLSRRWAWAAAGVVRGEDPADPPALVAAVVQRHPQQTGAAVRTLLATAPAVVHAWGWPTWVALAAAVVADTDGVPADPDDLARRTTRLHATPGFEALIEVVRAAADRAGGTVTRGGELRRVARAVVALTAPELVTDPAAIRLAEQWLAEPPSEARPHRAPAELDIPADELPTTPTDLEGEPRTAATTAVGGILFLHHVLRWLDVPARWCEPAHPLARRPLVESLVLLAVALTEAEPTDPGVLAFGGRAPGDRVDVPDPTDDEREAIARTVAEVDAALIESLPVVAYHDDITLRQWVIRRAGRVDADPGWIEASFAIEDIDTDIRKAGLDIDPGFVPYLGCVLRFRYV